MKAREKNKTHAIKKIFHNEAMNSQIKAVFLVTLAVFIFAGIHFTQQTGFVGVFLNSIFRTLFGEAAITFPFMLGIIALSNLRSLEIENIQYRFAGLIILFCLLCVTLHLIRTEPGLLVGGDLYRFMFYLGWQQQGGGVLGAFLTMLFFFLFKDIGSYIVISSLGALALLLITNSSLIEILRGVLSSIKSAVQYFGLFSHNIWGKLTEENKKRGSAESYTIKEYNNFEVNIAKEVEEKDEEKVLMSAPNKKEKSAIPVTTEDFENNNNTANVSEMEEESRSLSSIMQESRPLEDYIMPPVTLLTKVNKLRDYQQQKVIQERAKALESTFESFGVNVRIKEVQAGPAVTRFEIQPEIGVKVSKILSLSDDLALNLAAPDVRIEAPIPGKAAIGIEVPNKIISLVYLREVLEDPYFNASPSPLTLGLGKDITGTPVFGDLLKMHQRHKLREPHLKDTM